MTVVLLFLAGVGGVAAWWLSHQRLASKPWLEQGVIGEGQEPAPGLAAKVGLGVFLAVAGSLFALSISAYAIRVQGVDWWPLPVPRLLWLNTVLLALSSAALEWAKWGGWRAATASLPAQRTAEVGRVRTALLIAAMLAVAFLLGQMLAWRQLVAEGYGLASNPANSFFYLITGLHGLHVVGGLVALFRTIARATPEAPVIRLRLATGLCAAYWHFLLAIWLLLLVLLAGWASDLLSLCRQLLT